MGLAKKRNTMNFINVPKIHAMPLSNEVEIESKPLPNPSPVTLKSKITSGINMPPLITID
jgi:hypothetical protein